MNSTPRLSRISLKQRVGIASEANSQPEHSLPSSLILSAKFSVRQIAGLRIDRAKDVLFSSGFLFQFCTESEPTQYSLQQWHIKDGVRDTGGNARLISEDRVNSNYVGLSLKTRLIVIIAFAMVFVISPAAVAQKRKTVVAVFQLGNQATRIPAPAGFEEAASQFEKIKTHFSATEAPDNDMLAIHMSRADCKKLRAGAFGPFDFYTKVSIRRAVREEEYSAERFANLITTFRQSGTQILDINGPAMKDIVKRLDKSLTELNQQETEVELGQPVNLGEFDTRPNVYSVMLLMNFSTKAGEATASVPILGGLSYVRIKQRLVYVYTYRRYKAEADVQILRDFTRKWVGQILAANRPARPRN